MMAFKIQAESKFKPKIADKSQLNCKHCNRDGHDETTCFQLHGYPDWWGDRPRGRRTAGRGNRGGGRSGSAAGRGNGRREQRAGASPARLNKTTAAASSLQQAGGINLAKSKDGLSDREEIVMADIDLKQQNSNNGLQGSESNDRISSLHDSILHHILSFLPTRDVVRTGILSKQWKSLWIGVSIFDISDCRCCSRACWNFVERVLLLRNRSSIKQFKLCFRSYATSSYPRVQSIISSLVSHKIPHLDISLYVNDQFTLPSSIFYCQSLRILKLKVLKGSRRKLTLEHISLPCLKVLHLHDFAFQNAESIEKLFSCCPVLEELNLERCGLIHRNSMTISIPSLKSLTMVDSFENFDLPKSSCYIKVEAPSLQSFNYTGLFTHHLYLTNMSSSSSIEACIRMIWNDYYVGIRAPRFVKLLQDLENMISLTISNQAVELLLLLEDTDSDRFPVFHHLESLHLNFKLTDHVFQGLLKFIYFFTPNLRTIKFSDVKFWMLQPLTNCFSSSLRFLELQNVDGHSSELFFLTCFLEKAALLQKINIYQSEYISVDKQQVLRDEVEMLSTRFKHCAINVW